MSRSFGFVSCSDEVVEAFVLGEVVADGPDCIPEVIVGSGGGFAEHGLELGAYEGMNPIGPNDCPIDFDGVQIRRVGRQRQEPTADVVQWSCSIAEAFGLLWLDRLSRMITSPGCRVGASWVVM